MVKVAVNNDFAHYSYIVKSSMTYKRIKVATICLGVIFALIILICIGEYSTEHKVSATSGACAGFGFGGFFVFLIMLIKSNPRITYKKFNQKNPDLTGEIIFDDNSFAINSRSRINTKQAKYDYAQIASVTSGKGYILVLVENAGYISFNEKDMLEGSIDDIKALLRQKAGSKYKGK